MALRTVRETGILLEGDTVSDIATIVGLVTDVVLLILVTAVLIGFFVVFALISKLLSTAQSTLETVQDAAETVSERVINPATENVGTSRRIGSAVGFLIGLLRRKRQSNGN